MASQRSRALRMLEHGAEDLAGAHLHVARHVGEHRRAQAALLGARRRSASVAPWSTASWIQPLTRSTSAALMSDDDVGGLVERVADLERRDRRDEQAHELVVDLLVDDDALHADADLARVGEAAGDDALRRELQVGVLVDDRRRVVAELESDHLHAGVARRSCARPAGCR